MESGRIDEVRLCLSSVEGGCDPEIYDWQYGDHDAGVGEAINPDPTSFQIFGQLECPVPNRETEQWTLNPL
jgi:hypothetical protein